MESTQQFEQSYKELLIICTGLTTKRQEQRTLKNTLWLRERNRGSSWKGHLPPKAGLYISLETVWPQHTESEKSAGLPQSELFYSRKAEADGQEPAGRDGSAGTSLPWHQHAKSGRQGGADSNWPHNLPEGDIPPINTPMAAHSNRSRILGTSVPQFPVKILQSHESNSC